MAISTLDQTGLTIESQSQIVADLTAGMQTIYGASINVNSNSPDGQFINLMAQVLIDLLELVQAVYNSFSVASAYGTQLDNRVALNGLQRQAGTYTVAQVNITVSGAVTLYGLDQPTHTTFTVADSTGNKFQLAVTHVFSGAGNATLAFQSAVIGQVQTTPNTQALIRPLPTSRLTSTWVCMIDQKLPLSTPMSNTATT